MARGNFGASLGSGTAFENPQQEVWLRPQSGWQLEPLQRRANRLNENASIQSAILGAADLQTPLGWTQINQFSPLAELGITYGTDTVASGDPFWTKLVTAGSDWSSGNYQLMSDNLAFPGPPSFSTSAATTTMDRILVSNQTYAGNQTFFLRFSLPGIKSTTPDKVLTFYFPGPAGSISGGIGMYAICFSGDGEAQFFEATSMEPNPFWQLVDQFPYCSRHQVVSMMHFVHISPSSYTLNSSLGGSIVFEFSQVKQAGALNSFGGSFLSSTSDSRVQIVPIPMEYSNPTLPNAPIRVDVRRDLRPNFQISKAIYPASATLVDDCFSFPFLPSNTNPIALAWFSKTDPGQAVVGRLYDPTSNLELSNAGAIGSYPLYHPTFGKRNYFAGFVLSGDTLSTPTLFGYRAQRDGISANSTETEIALEAETRKVEVSLAGLDASLEMGRIHLDDVLGQLVNAFPQGEGRLRVEIDPQVGSSEPRINLFSGSFARPILHPRGARGGSVFPSDSRAEIVLFASSAWQRLASVPMMVRFDFGLDFNNSDAYGRPLPFKASDVLISLFALGGFSASEVSIPSSSVTLFPTTDPNGWMFDPQSTPATLIKRIAKEYFGGFVYFDANPTGTSPNGTWRLKPFTAPSLALATFVNSVSAGKLPHSTQSYPAGTTYIRRDSLEIEVLPPEANIIIAYGLGSPTGPGQTPILLKQVLTNFTSFNYLTSPTAVPNSLDYLGYEKPLLVYIPTTSTENGLSWMARRLFDQHCHGRRLRKWQSPLLFVTDPVTALQRTLLPNDGVMINGVLHRVRSIDAEYSRDDFQFCWIEAEEVMPWMN